MYVCGMTVYSDVHIGHARTYLAFDIIRRYLEHKGYTVTYVQNITDVDDKIITAASKEGIDPLKYAERYTQRCLQDLDRLGIRRADHYPKASETIPDMITMIQQILEHNNGYIANGDVYFSVEKFNKYGKLSGQNINEMKTGARITPGEKKQNPLDFALWKAAKPGEPAWSSPWGKGRPGWHIECSTMSSKLLSLPFDIHGGGMDLRFPHHENEIAQAEAATGKPFANYWIHIGLLTVNGEKMSKSLGNIINVQDILKKWEPIVLRIFFAQTHYRSPPDFTEKALTDVKISKERIYRLKEKLETLSKKASPLDTTQLNKSEQQYLNTIQKFQQHFEHAMDDDFNTPQAFATLFDFITQSNRFIQKQPTINPSLWKHALDMYLKLGSILTLFQEEQPTSKDEKALQESIKKLLEKHRKPPTPLPPIEQMINTLLEIRENARKQNQWTTADQIRSDLEKLGLEIQDTQTGPVWRKKRGI